MNRLIPPYLDDGEPVFIKIAQNSKAPKKGNSAKEGPFYRINDSELKKHIERGGNVGRVFHDDYIGIDVDHEILLEELADWPDTLVIESGGDDLGYHYYYQVPTWKPNQKELTADGKNVGSIRSGNSYCVCPPSIHPKSGNEYRVQNPRKVAEVSTSRLSLLLDEFGSAANTGGGAARGDPGGSSSGVGGADEPIPQEYPNYSANWETVRSWLESNGFLDDLDRRICSDWSGLEFKLGKCLAEGGFSETVISDALDRLHHNSKWHRRGRDYQELTVQKAIEAAVDDEYVEFASPNDGKEKGRDLPEGQTDRSTTMDYTSKESLTVYNGSSPEEAEDGDRVIRVELTNMQGTGDNGEPVDTDFVSIQKGTLRDNGEFGVSPEFNSDSKSVGQADPSELRLIAEGLEQLADDLE